MTGSSPDSEVNFRSRPSVVQDQVLAYKGVILGGSKDGLPKLPLYFLPSYIYLASFLSLFGERFTFPFTIFSFDSQLCLLFARCKFLPVALSLALPASCRRHGDALGSGSQKVHRTVSTVSCIKAHLSGRTQFVPAISHRNRARCAAPDPNPQRKERYKLYMRSYMTADFGSFPRSAPLFRSQTLKRDSVIKDFRMDLSIPRQKLQLLLKR